MYLYFEHGKLRNQKKKRSSKQPSLLRSPQDKVHQKVPRFVQTEKSYLSELSSWRKIFGWKFNLDICLRFNFLNTNYSHLKKNLILYLNLL